MVTEAMATIERDYKFVAILNKKIEIAKLMNALGHMTAGLAANYSNTDEMKFLQYVDGDGGIHPNISHYGFIILQADNSNKIRILRTEVMANNIAFTDFTSTMTHGTSKEQLERTKQTKELDLEYYSICMFGKTEVIDALTKKFSLYR